MSFLAFTFSGKQQKLLDEGNIDGKQQDHFLKGNGKKNYKNVTHTNGSGPQQECPNQKTKMRTKELSNSQKYRKKKTCQFYGKNGHVEKTCWKKSVVLEDNVKRLEGDVIVVCLTSCLVDEFTFNIKTYQELWLKLYRMNG